MQNILKIFSLKKGAELLDSKAYISKAFFAVATAYILGIKIQPIQMDMISVLFGTMLTLEPVNFGGIRSGKSQIYATVLGAASGALVVSLIGINVVSVALSVSLTLYIALKINWREVPVIAFFTAIYMTQIVQLDAFGNPNIWLTAKLRLGALIFGILVGMIYNFIFSFISYKNIANKRLIYCIREVSYQMDEIAEVILQHDYNKFDELKYSIHATFNNIDWVIGVFSDIKQENKLKAKLKIKTKESIELHTNIAIEMRAINHSLNDIVHTISKQKENKIETKYANYILKCREKLNEIKLSFENGNYIEEMPKLGELEEMDRILANLIEIRYSINSSIYELNKRPK